MVIIILYRRFEKGSEVGIKREFSIFSMGVVETVTMLT